MYFVEFLLIVIILILDISFKVGIVKALGVVDHFQNGDDISFIKGLISFSYTENTGATFGSFHGKTTALTVITAIGLSLLLIYLFFNKKESKFFRLCLIMIFAGGLGNLYDRIALGYVRDFIVFDFWPSFATFNIADSFLTVSTILVVIYAIFFMPKQIMREQKAQEEKDKNIEKAYPYDSINDKEIVTEDLEVKDNENI